MLEIQFGIQVDMIPLGAFIQDLKDVVGEIDDIDVEKSDKIVWDTETGLVTTLRGDFTGGQGEVERLQIHTQGGSLVMMATDFNDQIDARILMDDDGLEAIFDQFDEGVAILGSRFADTLVGGDDEDFLNGGAGDDVLDGLAGNDALQGGAGNDTYILNSSTEINKVLSDPGVDLVKVSLGYTLGAQQENLTLTGAASINGTGNTRANIVWGNDRDNTLAGAAGDDTLHGRAGTDVLNGQAGADILDGGPGDDRLVGSAGIDTASGSSGNDVVEGGDGGDDLRGQDGADTLDGGAGADTLSGGKGVDIFRFDAAPGPGHVDTISDFGGAGPTVLDVLQLESSVFTALPAGSLAASAFETGADNNADGADTRIIYNTETGALYYDEDGAGGAAAVRFAVLATSPDGLSAADFAVT